MPKINSSQSFSNCWAIVPAAGESRRMGDTISKNGVESKVLLPLSENPSRSVLEESLFKICSLGVTKLIIPTRLSLRTEIIKLASGVAEWEILEVIQGGETRFHSIHNALTLIQGMLDAGESRPESILVHDAARPFFAVESMLDVMENVNEGLGSVLAVPVTSTLKIVNSDRIVTSTPDRSSLWDVQTPQVFPYADLWSAYQKGLDSKGSFYDDASVYEAAGFKVKIVEGSYQNIKITSPEDLRLARLIFAETH
jgi:2-C-methyl-D-erythritol 4-phosphate cytidylyltransferase